MLLSVTSHINCIAARCLVNVVYLTDHDDVALFETSPVTPNRRKIKNYVIIASLKSETSVN